MVDQAEREPTMEEIVVALRETRKGAAPTAPFTVVGGRRGDSQVPDVATDAQSRTAGSTDIAALRDSEIERLLADNARLNERVMFLLKVMEREQTRSAQPVPEHAPAETDPGAIVDALRSALQAELSPVLQVLLRVLEKQRTEPTAREPAWPTARPDNDGIIDLDAQRA
jgi:hypothetical protein